MRNTDYMHNAKIIYDKLGNFENVLEKTHYNIIVWSVNDSLNLLWPEKWNKDKFHVILSDTVAYMLKTAIVFKEL
jgi:hypothetical protein